MIAFGCAITHDPTYDRYAGPGIQLAREPDSAVLSRGSVGSIFRNYNMLMRQAAALDDLEALVLVHQDAEITDPEFCSKLRTALADPEVALVGCVGAVGVRSIAYWEGSVTWASFTHRYWEHGGGDFPGLSWAGNGARPPQAQTGEVDSIDGFVIALSPWALRELSFDESLGALHGYDFDICCAARAAGRKVVTADLQVIHHHSLDLVEDTEEWIDAHMATIEKWKDRVTGVGAGSGDWERRARRAEAEAALARVQVGEGKFRGDAQNRRIEAVERDLANIRRSPSWRLTAPLRALRKLGRRRA